MNEFRIGSGGRIDRNKPVGFSFNGETYTGFEGDSLASALLANGVHFVARSYKYHRPRGIMSAGNEEACALVGVNHGPGGRFDPNSRATTLELVDGLSADSQHCWPSLKWDIGEAIRLAGPVLSTGFYYKTFLWPKSFWKKIYEPVIRQSAGLGQAPIAPDPDTYSSCFAHCDVLVVGGGPAGIAAALAASARGAKIIFCDEQSEFGGDLLSSPQAQINNQGAWGWLAAAMKTLLARNNVTVLPRTTAFGYYEDNMLGLAQRLSDHLTDVPEGLPRERIWKVRAKKVVLATGSIERPLVFAGNDRPAIMLAGAAKTYLHRYGVKIGNNPALVTANDSAYKSIFALAEAGAKIAAIIDVRNSVDPELLASAKQLGIEVLVGHTILQTSGRFRIRSFKTAPIDADGKQRTIVCDALLVSGGWTPTVHLFSQSRGRLKWNDEIGAAVPDEHVQHSVSVGACNGDFSLSSALNQNGSKDHSVKVESPQTSDNYSQMSDAKSGSKSGLAFVDLQHDVLAKDIDMAVREGFHSIEHIKRYTTTGMATDQGKTSNINGLFLASKALGRPMSEIGLTTFRPPFTPVTFGALAGHSTGPMFDVTRKSPTDKWAQQNGAVFESVGQWRRASYFPKKGESRHQAIVRECVATRASIGISDASTLGKIEVVGPDAGEFLERFYPNSLRDIVPGRCRYVLALREDGFIYDDGVVACLDENRFHLTTTTGGAARVFANMEDYRQTEWTDLKVWLTSISEQWAVIALNGPNVKKLIAPLVKGIDLAGKNFPHMSVGEGTIFGVPLRLFRVSFTGELGFEINVPSRFAHAVWEQLMMVGKRYDIIPYGIEALHYLRAEKGYIIVGQDTDGSQTPMDMGMGWAIGKNKEDFIGKRSLSRPDIVAKGRPQLVGLLTQSEELVLEEGAQISAENSKRPPVKMIGHVTSSYWSEACGRSIAMGLIEGGASRLGEEVYIPMPDKVHRATIVKPVFYDPAGERLNA